MNDLINYCLSFYGPGGLYADFFGQPVDAKRIVAAIAVLEGNTPIETDSVTREFVRDVMLHREGRRPEYGVVVGWCEKFDRKD